MKYRDGLPVAPGAWPLLGHLPRAMRAMPELIGETRDRLGQVFWIGVLGNWVLVCTGEGAAELLKHPSFSSAHLPEVSPIVAGESLLSHDGPSHRRMRSAMSKPLSPRGLSSAGVGAISKSAIEQLVSGWMERGRARVLPEVQEVALEIIFRMLGVQPAQLPSWRRYYRDLLLANLGTKSMVEEMVSCPPSEQK